MEKPNMTYYADTAYDSNKPYDLPPIDNSAMRSGVKALRRYPLKQPRGTHCGEFLSFSNIYLLAHEDDPEAAWEGDGSEVNIHEEYYWHSLKNPKTAIEYLTAFLCFWLIVAGGGGTILAVFAMGFWEAIKGSVMVNTIPLMLYLLGKYLLRNNIVADKNNVILNRRTGLVTINHKGKQVKVPFAELDPYYLDQVSIAGSQDFQLSLAHRYTERWTPSLQYHHELHDVYRDWELWQQYMDISKPLPDIPEFELFRHKDPVTAAWDKKHNRPKDYWRSLDPEKANKMEKASWQAVETYPWGQTRDQAIASGWQPSGFGQGDWLKG